MNIVTFICSSGSHKSTVGYGFVLYTHTKPHWIDPHLNAKILSNKIIYGELWWIRRRVYFFLFFSLFYYIKFGIIREWLGGYMERELAWVTHNQFNVVVCQNDSAAPSFTQVISIFNTLQCEKAFRNIICWLPSLTNHTRTISFVYLVMVSCGSEHLPCCELY